MGLVNRVVPAGQSRGRRRRRWPARLAALPQACLRSDRASALEGLALA